MILGDIAHSRTGDKGNHCNISVIAFKQEDYAVIAEKITAERVKHFFEGKVKGKVVRYEIPQLGALNFMLYDALDGGVTRSLGIDVHGKCLSQFLLTMET